MHFLQILTLFQLNRNISSIYLRNRLGCNAVAAISTDYFQNGGIKQGNIFKSIQDAFLFRLTFTLIVFFAKSTHVKCSTTQHMFQKKPS